MSAAVRRRCSPVADRLQKLLERCEALLPPQKGPLPAASGEGYYAARSAPGTAAAEQEFLGNYQTVPLNRNALVAVLSEGALQVEPVQPDAPPPPPAQPQGQVQLQQPLDPAAQELAAPTLAAAGAPAPEPAQRGAPPPPTQPQWRERPQPPQAAAPAAQGVVRYVLDPSTSRYVVQQPVSPGVAAARAAPPAHEGGARYVYDPSTGAYHVSVAGGALAPPVTTSRRGAPVSYVQLPAGGRPTIAPPQYMSLPGSQRVSRQPSLQSGGGSVSAPATGLVATSPLRELPGMLTPSPLASMAGPPGSPGSVARPAGVDAGSFRAAPARAPAAQDGAAAAPAAAPAGSVAVRRPAPPQPAPAPSQAPAPPAAAAPPAAPRPRTILSPTVQLFSQASVPAGPGGAAELLRAPLLDGLDALAASLDKLSNGMGEHLQKNVRKLRASKADASESSYGAWLLSEAPVHEATKFRGYVDDSAWMANLWAYRTLDFFVELFGLVAQGRDTREATDAAYAQTLSKHHNMLERMAFSAGARQLPNREEFIKRLAGAGAGADDVQRDLESFVASGRGIVAFCDGMNKRLEVCLADERKKFERR